MMDHKYLTALLAFNQKDFFIRHYRNPNRSNPNWVKYSAHKNNLDETMHIFFAFVEK